MKSLRISIFSTFLFIKLIQSESGVIRVNARHIEPFIYQNANGTFENGIEYHLIQAIATKLKMKLQFVSSNHELNGTTKSIQSADILIGGLFIDSINISDQNIISYPYFSDDFTWCVQNANYVSFLLFIFVVMSPTVWVMIFFGFGYTTSTLLYLLIQFDEKYEQRNRRDWHYTTLLIALPAVLGINQQFKPKSGIIRIIYGSWLLTALFGVQMVFVYLVQYIQIRIPKHQVATVNEIVDYNYGLMGSQQVQNLVWTDEKVSS